MLSFKEAYNDWKATCTVPDHPKRCPLCNTKVKLYHTPDNIAAFLCSNAEKCVWPIESDLDFTGESDFLKFYQYIKLKDERKIEKRNKRKKRTEVQQDIEDEDCFESFQFEKLSAFLVPTMMSPIARTPRREREEAPIPEVNTIVDSQTEQIEPVRVEDLLEITNEQEVSVTQPIASNAKAADGNDFKEIDNQTQTSELSKPHGEHVVRPETPRIEPEKDVDIFLRPSSLPATPFHFPSLLSPLPNTPRRIEPRTPKYHLMDDLKLTSDESDMSDFEKTPRAGDSERYKYSFSPRYPPVPPSSDQNSKVKVLLTRDRSSSEWNISSEKSTAAANDVLSNDVNDIDGLILPGPSRPGSIQGNKLDKVVLNLKKSAGSNQWNVDANPVTESSCKNLDEIRSNEMLSTAQRRGRKASTVTKRNIPLSAAENTPQNENKSVNLNISNSAKGQSSTKILAEDQKVVPKPSMGYKLLTLDELANRRSFTSESESEISPAKNIPGLKLNLRPARLVQTSSSERDSSASPVKKVSRRQQKVEQQEQQQQKLPSATVSPIGLLNKTCFPTTPPPTVQNGKQVSPNSKESPIYKSELWNTKLLESGKGKDQASTRLPNGAMSLSVPGVVPLTEKQSGNVAMKQSKFLTPQSEDSDGKSEDSSTFLKAPTIKTFSRKDRPNYKVLSSLSNRVTMNCGLNVSISIPDLATLPQDVSQPKQQQEQPPHKEEAWQKITELMTQLLSENDDPEVGHLQTLMKSVSSSKSISESVDILKRVQTSLNLSGRDSMGRATLHVGQGKSNIDLPAEDSLIDVTMDNRGNRDVQIMLTSNSDGIEASELKRPLTPPLETNSTTTLQGRGRPKKVPTRCTIDFNADFDEYQETHFGQMSPPNPTALSNEVIDNWENNQFVVDTFFFHLGCLMQSYQFPPEWAAQGIDPCVAMMISRSQDPAYASIDFSSMLQLYAKLTAHQQLQRQQEQQHQQQLHEQQLQQLHEQQLQQLHEQQLPQVDQSQECVPINLSMADRQNADRTYAELQTVRLGVGVDATEVLRHHNEQEPETPSSGQNNSAVQTPTRNIRVKEEVVLPNSPSFPNSVIFHSVRPGPKSVTEISKHDPVSGKIGQGTFFISAQYQNSMIGPIYVETETELKFVSAIIQQKVGELKSKSETGSKLPHSSSTAAIRARSILKADVLEYLDRAFTLKGLKENILGRKKNNYPKRSAVIRTDPNTGQLNYPGESPVKPKDIPVRFIKLEPKNLDRVLLHAPEIQIPANQLERLIFVDNPLPQAKMVRQEKRVSGLACASDMAQQILQTIDRQTVDNNTEAASATETVRLESFRKTPAKATPKEKKATPPKTSKSILRLLAAGQQTIIQTRRQQMAERELPKLQEQSQPKILEDNLWLQKESKVEAELDNNQNNDDVSTLVDNKIVRLETSNANKGPAKNNRTTPKKRIILVKCMKPIDQVDLSKHKEISSQVKNTCEVTTCLSNEDEQKLPVNHEGFSDASGGPVLQSSSPKKGPLSETSNDSESESQIGMAKQNDTVGPRTTNLMNDSLSASNKANSEKKQVFRKKLVNIYPKDKSLEILKEKSQYIKSPIVKSQCTESSIEKDLNLSVSSFGETSIDLSEDCNSADTSTIDINFDLDSDIISAPTKNVSSKRPFTASKVSKSIFDICDSPKKKKPAAKSMSNSPLEACPKIVQVTSANTNNLPEVPSKVIPQTVNSGFVIPMVSTNVEDPSKHFGNLLPSSVWCPKSPTNFISAPIKSFSSQQPITVSSSYTKMAKSIFDLPESPKKKTQPAKTTNSSPLEANPKIVQVTSAANTKNLLSAAPKDIPLSSSVAPKLLTSEKNISKNFGNPLHLNAGDQISSPKPQTPVWTLTSAFGSISSTSPTFHSNSVPPKIIVKPVGRFIPVLSNVPATSLNSSQVLGQQRASPSTNDDSSLILPCNKAGNFSEKFKKVGKFSASSVGNLSSSLTASSVKNYSSSQAVPKVANHSLKETNFQTNPSSIDVPSHLAILEQNVPPHSSLIADQSNNDQTEIKYNNDNNFEIEQKWMGGSQRHRGKKSAASYSRATTGITPATSAISISQMIDSVLKKAKEEEQARSEQKENCVTSSELQIKSVLNRSEESCTTDQQVDKSPDLPIPGGKASNLAAFTSSIVTRKSSRLKSTDSNPQEPIRPQRQMPSTSQDSEMLNHNATTLVAQKFKSVFVRSQKEVTVEESLKRKEKHDEKLARREERKLAKKSFIGFTQDKNGGLSLAGMKFTKAVPINGVKRVLKATGDLVEVGCEKKRRKSMADHPISDHPKTDERTFISDEERALMDSLLQVGFDAINHHSSYAQPPTNSRPDDRFRPAPSISILDQFEMSHTQDPTPLGADVPSLDDLL